MFSSICRMCVHYGLLAYVFARHGMLRFSMAGRRSMYLRVPCPMHYLVLDSPFWLVLVGEGLAAVSGTARSRSSVRRALASLD